jgi:hypothetical protein
LVLRLAHVLVLFTSRGGLSSGPLKQCLANGTSVKLYLSFRASLLATAVCCIVSCAAGCLARRRHPKHGATCVPLHAFAFVQIGNVVNFNEPKFRFTWQKNGANVSIYRLGTMARGPFHRVPLVSFCHVFPGCQSLKMRSID